MGPAASREIAAKACPAFEPVNPPFQLGKQVEHLGELAENLSAELNSCFTAPAIGERGCRKLSGERAVSVEAHLS